MKRTRLLIALCSALGLSSVANSSEDLTTFIYNGQTTTTATWPSYAAVYYDATSLTGVYGQYCGATILDADHVMLAAHCVTDGSGGMNYEYLVYTSILPQLSNKSQFLSGTVENIRAQYVYVHPEYVDSSSDSTVPWPNDIAIIKLESSMNVDSSAYVSRAQSSQVNSYRIEDKSFVAVGMGLTEDKTYATQLLWTNLNYEPTNSCKLGAGESQLCMKGSYDPSTRVRNTTCSGDSGGPLYWYDSSKFEYYQVGITSYGWKNCYNESSEDVAVFTEVADYNAWIDNVLSNSETPDLEITDQLRTAIGATVTDPGPIINDTTTDESGGSNYQTTSDSSGGSVGLATLGLFGIAGLRRRQLSST
ncbi:trypsin-like serine protease [Vibrio owensii]|uniref:Peptidase S1 domain-containing protein n=1 Tax=Vibrio owensii CAIM 1854 = LMG 25443 TaxID=1229493 RepID=A0A0C1ZIN2_9VIBR|nr:trypsin-like serine protease [Vibrio owensii]KIF53086.1 hypothetical protein H735_09060 [Vibrio owensii CAIM 1854 = LMG 25443]